MKIPKKSGKQPVSKFSPTLFGRVADELAQIDQAEKASDAIARKSLEHYLTRTMPGHSMDLTKLGTARKRPKR